MKISLFIKFYKKFVRRFSKFYPYDNCSKLEKLRIFSRVFFLKLFNKFIYPDISLVKYMKDLYGVKTDKEFLRGYYTSKINFDGLWSSKPRNTRDQIESFYREHDKDVWRQVYLSKYDRHKRNNVLKTFSLIRSYSNSPDLKILDYGCGCAVFSHYLYKKGYRNIALADIESSTLRFVERAFAGKFKFIRIDQTISLSEIYDVVLLISVLAHTYEPFETIRHILNHLNKGGVLIIDYEKGIDCTHLAVAAKKRSKVMDYIYSNCKCIKEDEVFIKL